MNFWVFISRKITGENGVGSNIKITPSKTSIQKAIERISSIKEERLSSEITGKSKDNLIKNIHTVIDPWICYYKHTDYSSGLERIKESLGNSIKELI